MRDGRMTAEIAIVNRSAITLAADSAMTLSVRGAQKIYTGADKIFELSEKNPIGLMIFNNLEFMGVPLDVAIKHFRGSPDCLSFDALRDVADAFFNYLTRQWNPTDDMQRSHARKILQPVYRRVRQRFNQQINQILTSRPARSAVNPFPQTITESVQYVIDEYEHLPPSECFVGTSENDLLPFYQQTLDDLIQQSFPGAPFDLQQTALFERVGVLALHRDKFSVGLSGMVFAGFGSQDLFPALLSYHIDGIIGGKLKKKAIDDEKTGQDTIAAKIIPFAQRDIVDRFLVGIDPDLEGEVLKYVKSARDRTENNIFDGLPRLTQKNKQKILDNLSKSLGVAVSDFESVWLKTAKEKYQQQTEDMVLFMAKQELAQLAEALVNITSIKRKFSAEEETVAGPIDVAVISRSDGFVWVKRKHYFPSDLNPRYFVRKFGILGPTQGGNHAAP
jgi:hypothetical protein